MPAKQTDPLYHLHRHLIFGLHVFFLWVCVCVCFSYGLQPRPFKYFSKTRSSKYKLFFLPCVLSADTLNKNGFHFLPPSWVNHSGRRMCAVKQTGITIPWLLGSWLYNCIYSQCCVNINNFFFFFFPASIWSFAIVFGSLLFSLIQIIDPSSWRAAHFGCVCLVHFPFIFIEAFLTSTLFKIS